jgi:hypothetical protein
MGRGRHSARIVADPIYGCHLYQGPLNNRGYAISWRGMPISLHREAWERAHGPIPEGMEVEHMCRRRNCLSLAHLELVDRSTNEKLKLWRYRVKRKTCPCGHSMELAIVTPEGGRLCRTCARDGKTNRHLSDV